MGDYIIVMLLFFGVVLPAGVGIVVAFVKACVERRELGRMPPRGTASGAD
ncbi:hypothetical protein J7F03_19355 [Streptomyces sp. ISL-43]|nr:hypothetical protein [Streptomyces sp. ISL-43]MBT2449212.1 hypothetical protein [Streptomyces sp. ISL-43]